MSYHFSKTISMPMDKAIDNVTSALAAKGFGVLTTIDVAATLKKKLDVEFRPYVILGACNPGFAYKALQEESRVGTMLPCNVILQQVGEDLVEVSAVDPIASMQGVDNPGLTLIAGDVRELLRQAVDGL
jgi:uncharacterized protein (DUF302 family)